MIEQGGNKEWATGWNLKTYLGPPWNSLPWRSDCWTLFVHALNLLLYAAFCARSLVPWQLRVGDHVLPLLNSICGTPLRINALSCAWKRRRPQPLTRRSRGPCTRPLLHGLRSRILRSPSGGLELWGRHPPRPDSTPRTAPAQPPDYMGLLDRVHTDHHVMGVIRVALQVIGDLWEEGRPELAGALASALSNVDTADQAMSCEVSRRYPQGYG